MKNSCLLLRLCPISDTLGPIPDYKKYGIQLQALKSAQPMVFNSWRLILIKFIIYGMFGGENLASCLAGRKNFPISSATAKGRTSTSLTEPPQP